MAVEYISYLQTEKLFTQWPVVQGMKESLQLEIDAIEKKQALATKEEYIATLSVGNKVLTGTPPPSKTTDKTSEVATNYPQIMDSDYTNTINKILEEKFYIGLVDDKLYVAFSKISVMQQQLLKLFYWENKTWAEVVDELKQAKCYLSKYQAQIQRQYGIERIRNISKITTKAYDFVMEMMGVG